MKKRIVCLVMVLCLLISVLPVSASAATAYELYINEFQFTSNQKTYSEGGGTATYDPDGKTLTLKNINLTSGAVNAVIYSDISGLKIVVDGKNTVNLRDSDSSSGENICTQETNYALLANYDTTIVGKSGNPATDQLVISSKSVGVTTPLSDGTTRVGVYNGGKLTMENVTLSMTDSSTGNYAGHASMIRAGGKTTITGCRLDAQKCQLGLYMGMDASATVRNTAFSMTLAGDSSSALNFTPGTTNLLENCTGTLSAAYPLYTYGAVTVKGSGKLTLRASNMAAVAKQYGTGVAGGSLTFENANVEIISDGVGIQVEENSSATVSGGTVDVTAAQAINLYGADSKLSLTAGRLKLTGLSTEDSVGISTKGAVEVTGGTLETSTVNSAIQNLGTKTVLFTGGTHTLTATAAGYADNAAGTLQIGGSADVTVNAAIGIRLSQGKGGKLNLTGGEVKLNSSSSGLQTQSGAGKTTLSGGMLTVTDTNEEPNIYGIDALGETEFSGTTVSFRNCKYDIRSGNSNNKITDGRVNLSGQIGLFAVGNFTVVGGELFSSCSTYGILSANGTISLKGGKIRMEDKNYDIIAFQKSVIDFAGADVEAKSAEHFALAIYDEESSYQVTGGTVVLQSIQSGANKLYTALADGYGVWAGASAESAVRVANVTESTLQTNKYVRIAKIQSYTLTLVNVREGTSASVTGGDTITYTAKDAPAGQHFSHWTLTVNGSTEEAGTDATYSGKMPDADATLTAVYEDCHGGTATCTEKAICEVCGRSYGEPLPHSYTAETAEEQYLKSAADCENAAVYYKSCTGCGASSKGTEAEATFTHGDPLGHDYGAWISNGNGTHTHTCSHDKSHTETKDCHGGKADCTHKAVCEDCGAQYGETSDHNYTAEIAEEQYLISAADCENAAVYYKSCTGCGASSKGTEAEATFTHGDPLGHDYGAWISNGNGTHTHTCSHDKSHTETKDCHGGKADCTHKAVCEDCGAQYGETSDHNYTAETAEEQYLISAADCENAAVYYKSCTGCGASSKGTEAEAAFTHGDPLGHDYGAWISNGNGTHTHTCSHDKSHTETKDCHGGKADCTHKAVCEDCGAQYGETSDHNYTAEIAEEQYLKSAADCENAAVYYKSCTGCGASSKGTEAEATFTHGDPLGHMEIIDSGIEPTCVDAGLSEGKHCERCGKTLIEQFELEALSHDVPDGTVLSDPTCSKAGEIIGTCTRCGAQAVSGSIPKLPHTEVKLPEVLASCTENGWTEGVKCSACGEILQGHTPIAPLAHQVVIDPETETLTEGKHCSVCGEILLPQLQKTGAYWTDEGNYDAALYASDPGNWVIEDAADLAALAKKVADGCSFAGFTITLAADIDLSAHIWVPIGQIMKFFDRPPTNNCFSGVFLGNLHQITGMRMIDESSAPRNGTGGLFGIVEQAEIRDLLVSGDVREINQIGSACAGGIVGTASDTVLENCGFVGSVYIRQENSGSYVQYAGGIAGRLLDSTLSNCFAISNIEIVNPATLNFAGGIAGAVRGFNSEATVENVYSVCYLSESESSDGICADSVNTTFRSCFSRLGFNASGAALITGTSCTDECMKALTGTKNDNVPCALVDSLNQAVLANGGAHTRAWIVDPNQNNGYPTFASAVRFQYPQTELEDTMQVVLPGECAEQPEDPVYQDYNFLGWYADAEFTTPFDFSQKIYETVTVYAKFLDPNHPHQFGSCILGADGLHDHVCSICGETIDCIYRQDVIEPTCQSAGYTVHTCLGCGASYMDAIVEGGHVWTKTVHEPTHTEMGYTHYSCERCGEAYDADYIEPSGHTFDEGTLTRAATCTAEGEMTYTCSCGATHTVPVPMAAHELESHVTAPTCTELGFTTHACKHCEYSYTDSYVGALGHDWDEGTVASAPSLTETGTLIQHCTRCDATLESKIPMLTTCDGGEGCPSSAYIDVPDVSNWAHVGIDFVLKSGFFYGTSDTTFSPNMAMTRAMLVTVLYRLEGRPGVTTENPFTDVPDGKWYTEAVIWAAEKGVVAGIGEGLFNPDGNVTREQIAVILRSYSAYKGYDTTARADLTTFPDHEEVSGWAYEAMSWANAAGLIAGAGANGTSYLMPKCEATRAQVATILMGYVKTIVSK